MIFWICIISDALPLVFFLYIFLQSNYLTSTFSQQLSALVIILYISIFILLTFFSFGSIEQAGINPEQIKVYTPSPCNFILIFSLIVTGLYAIGGKELIKLLAN